MREDAHIVDSLAAALRSNGVHVWLDRNNIQPGARWKDAIRTAIRNGTYFIACFSQSFHDRDKSFMFEELTLAIDELRQRPTNRIWFIPVLFDDSKIPDRKISEQESLADLQCVALTPDWLSGVVQILSVLRPDPAPHNAVPASAVISSLESAVATFGKAIKTIHTKMFCGDECSFDTRADVRSELIQILTDGLSVFKDDLASIQHLEVRRGTDQQQKRIAQLAEECLAFQWHCAALSTVFKNEKEPVWALACQGVVFLLHAARQVAYDSIVSNQI